MVKVLKNTPWGKPQSVEIVSDHGIAFYSTASHGGYKVEGKLNREIPEQFRCSDGWYEEDCEWSLVWCWLSCHFNQDIIEDTDKFVRTFWQAQQTMDRYYPHQVQQYHGLPLVRSEHCFDCQHEGSTCLHQDIEIYDPIATRNCCRKGCDQVIYRDTLDKDHGFRHRQKLGIFCSPDCAHQAYN